MKRVYYTQLAVASTCLEYIVQVDDQVFNYSVSIAATMIGASGAGPIHGSLYGYMKERLGHDQFILVPSPAQVELDASREDQMHHPEKYPTGDESIGGFGCRLADGDS